MRFASHRFAARAIETAVLAAMAVSDSAMGATFNVSWSGPATGLYGTATNWSTNVVPTNNVGASQFFNVTINRPGGAEVTGNTSASILNLTIGPNLDNALFIGDTQQLELIGAFGGGSATFSNAGTLSLGTTTASIATLLLNGITAAPAGISTNITGGGTIVMEGNAVITGQGTVTSNNTIIGRGLLGNNAINNFNNNGTVSASGSGSLTIDTEGTFKNNTLIQALSDGTLVLSGNGGGAIVNDGTIAVVSGGRLQLMNNISISGGTLSSALGSTAFFVPANHTATLSSLANNADVNVAITSTLNLTGTITNNGRIRSNASLGTATYNIGSGTVTLNGTGSLALSLLSGANGVVIGTGTLVNGASHSFFGAGSIGLGSLTLRNAGTIDAIIPGQMITIRAEQTGADGIVNSGVIRASNGELRVTNPVQITNTGTFDVGASGLMTFDVSNAAQVLGMSGGTINIAAGGTLRSVGGLGSIALQGVAIDNAGTIDMSGCGWQLSGGGSIKLLTTTSQLRGSGGFTNLAGTISGAGSIGMGELSIQNAGTISADVALETLAIDPGAGGLTNSGTIQAISNGQLTLTGSGGGTFNNTGSIIANGTNSRVFLRSGVSITGGTISTLSDGLVLLQASQSATLANVTCSGTLLTSGPSSLTLNGTVVNNGTFSASSSLTGIASILIGGGTTTLSGTGTLQLVTATGTLSTVGGSGTLVTGSSFTIRGMGRLGNTAIALSNAGTISATVTSGTLTISPGAGGLNNSGTIQAINNAAVVLNGASAATMINTGTILADGLSSRVFF